MASRNAWADLGKAESSTGVKAILSSHDKWLSNLSETWFSWAISVGGSEKFPVMHESTESGNSLAILVLLNKLLEVSFSESIIEAPTCDFCKPSFVLSFRSSEPITKKSWPN